MRRMVVVAAGVVALLLVAAQLRASSDVDPVNMVPAYGQPPTATQPPSGAAAASIASTLNAPCVPIHRFSPVPRRCERSECSNLPLIAICRA